MCVCVCVCVCVNNPNSLDVVKFAEPAKWLPVAKNNFLKTKKKVTWAIVIQKIFVM